MGNPQPHLIIFANEKGGTGKSTTAVHTAIALSALGHQVGLIDLDPRQRTVTRYMENRVETARRRGIDLPVPDFSVFTGDSTDALDDLVLFLCSDASAHVTGGTFTVDDGQSL